MAVAGPYTSFQVMREASCLRGNTGQGTRGQGEKWKGGVTVSNCYGLMVTLTSYSPMSLGVGGHGEDLGRFTLYDCLKGGCSNAGIGLFSHSKN